MAAGDAVKQPSIFFEKFFELFTGHMESLYSIYDVCQGFIVKRNGLRWRHNRSRATASRIVFDYTQCEGFQEYSGAEVD
jgi:hypothetical protein